MPLYLGLDCGGSTTRVLVIDDEGSELFRGKSGPANIASTDRALITQHLTEALSKCPAVDAAAGCFAGVLTAEDKAKATSILQPILPGSPTIDIWPDYAAALEAAVGFDALCIAGTGFKICWKLDGQLHTAGGGGPLIGDDGSTFALGRRLLRDTLLYDQPMSPGLRNALVERFGTSDVNSVIASIYRSPSPAAEIARLAVIDVSDSEDGRPASQQRVRLLLEQIAMEIRRALHGSFQSKPVVRLAATGGLWEIAPAALATVEDILNTPHELSPLLDHASRFEMEKLAVEPVIGAARLARNLIKL